MPKENDRTTRVSGSRQSRAFVCIFESRSRHRDAIECVDAVVAGIIFSSVGIAMAS